MRKGALLSIIAGTVRVTAVLLLFGLPPGTAQARNIPYSLTLTPFVGGYVFEGNQNLADKPVYGLAAGVNFTPHWATEIVYSGIPDTHSTDGTAFSVHSIRGDLLYHFLPERELVPYVAAGGGLLFLDPDRKEINNDATANYGAGLKYFLNDQMALRADVRHIFDFTVNDSVRPRDIYNQLAYTAGASFQFGGRKEPIGASPAEPQGSNPSAVSNPPVASNPSASSSVPAGIRVDDGNWTGTVTLTAPASLAGATTLVIYVDKSGTPQGSFRFIGSAMDGTAGDFTIIKDDATGMTISMPSLAGTTVHAAGNLAATVDGNGRKSASFAFYGLLNGQPATGSGTLNKMVPTITGIEPNHTGPDGTIAIRGANFSPVKAEDAVKFGTLPATILAVAADGTSMTVAVPAGATNSPITVSVGNETATSPIFTIDRQSGVSSIIGPPPSPPNNPAPAGMMGNPGGGFSPVTENNPVKRPIPPPAKPGMTASLQFDVYSANVKLRYHEELARIASFMKENPTVNALVEGHADDGGGPRRNMKLSQRRAENVAHYLAKHFGISRHRFYAKGYGETFLAAGTNMGSQKHSRVNIIVERTPKKV